MSNIYTGLEGTWGKRTSQKWLCGYGIGATWWTAGEGRKNKLCDTVTDGMTQVQMTWHSHRWHDTGANDMTATDGMTQVHMTWHRYKWHDTGTYGMTQVHMTWQSQIAWHWYRWHDIITDGMTKFSKWRGPSTCTNPFLHSLILPFILSLIHRGKEGGGPCIWFIFRQSAVKPGDECIPISMVILGICCNIFGSNVEDKMWLTQGGINDSL